MIHHIMVTLAQDAYIIPDNHESSFNRRIHGRLVILVNQCEGVFTELLQGSNLVSVLY